MIGWFLVYSEMIQLYIHMHNLFNIIFHYGLLQDIDPPSIGSCCLSLLYIGVCIC